MASQPIARDMHLIQKLNPTKDVFQNPVLRQHV
jgi:hypothetical protein